MKKPPNLPRIRAAYALKKLSRQLGSDVLSDGSISRRYQFDVSRPIELGGSTVMSQADLFRALRQVLAGEPITPLLDQDRKPFAADIAFEDDGSAVVKTGNRAFRFINAGLLAPDVTQRLEFLAKYLDGNTLAQAHAQSLRDLISKSEISDDEFLTAVQTLLTSPESFADSLLRKVNSRQVSVGELLPDDARHWDQLTAPIGESLRLSDFIEKELDSERRVLLSADPRKAIRAIALSFCAPGLVPVELFRACDTESVRKMLEESTRFSDHFGLVGAFEICGDWFGRDSSFGPLGDKLLDLLFSDMQRVKDSCAMYAAAFVIATSRLAQHQEWRLKPAFWRRLSAAAHASLVVRACGLSDINTESLFGWAMNISGKAYYMSICLDSRDEPRWRPDWISPKPLVADAVGRADAVLKRLPEGVRNPEWDARIQKARDWIKENDCDLMASYPAIGESAPRVQPALKDLGELAKLYQAFLDDPINVENFLMLGPAVYSFGIPAECVPEAVKLISTLRGEGVKLESGMVEAAISLAAYVSVQHRDIALATAVAEFCIQRATTVKGDHTAMEMIFRVIECAAANADKNEAFQVLARRLESVSFVVSPDRLADVYDSLLRLQTIDGTLARLLGRAIATARLGRGGKAA